MPPISERRKRFKSALALLEQTQSGFAREHKISLNHLQRILLGERKSPRIEAHIEAVIAEAALPAQTEGAAA